MAHGCEHGVRRAWAWDWPGFRCIAVVAAHTSSVATRRALPIRSCLSLSLPMRPWRAGLVASSLSSAFALPLCLINGLEVAPSLPPYLVPCSACFFYCLFFWLLLWNDSYSKRYYYSPLLIRHPTTVSRLPALLAMRTHRGLLDHHLLQA